MPARLVPLGSDDFYLEADALFCCPACEDAAAYEHAVNVEAARRAGLSVAEMAARFGWVGPEVLP